MPLDLEHVFREALARLSGETLTSESVSRARIDGPVHVLAVGKAACGMARGAARALEAVRGVAAAPRAGSVPPGVQLKVGNHPVPNGSSEAAGRALLEEARTVRPEETVLYLISGGGSAIAAVPAADLSLQAKIESTRALLRAGTPIEQTNAVRKHLSAIKAGHLAMASGPAHRRIALVLCDVSSGDLASVASGPTVGDPTTFAQCLDIVASSGVPLPDPVLARLRAGARGEIPETPKPDDPHLAGIEQVLLASPRDLARAVANVASSSGEPCDFDEEPFTGHVEGFADRLAHRIRSLRGPSCFALAGEVTVKVPSQAGSGGRMQHLALLLARSLAGYPFEALCAGSDGHDADTGRAGARIDGTTAARARAAGVDLDRAIARFDSATACAELGVALPAFDSGTNLCDTVLVRVNALAAGA